MAGTKAEADSTSKENRATFQAEDARRREIIDNMNRMQRERLASLNNPSNERQLENYMIGMTFGLSRQEREE